MPEGSSVEALKEDVRSERRKNIGQRQPHWDMWRRITSPLSVLLHYLSYIDPVMDRDGL